MIIKPLPDNVVIKACEVLGRMTGAYTNTVNLVLPVYGGEEDLED
jgi:hypothetical protein